MRFQVRVGEQYQELLEHLEGFKPEYRGKRLLALAAMQLSSSAAKKTSSSDDNITKEVVDLQIAKVESAESHETDANPALKSKKPPAWIKQNANS